MYGVPGTRKADSFKITVTHEGQPVYCTEIAPRNASVRRHSIAGIVNRLPLGLLLES